MHSVPVQVMVEIDEDEEGEREEELRELLLTIPHWKHGFAGRLVHVFPIDAQRILPNVSHSSPRHCPGTLLLRELLLSDDAELPLPGMHRLQGGFGIISHVSP